MTWAHFIWLTRPLAQTFGHTNSFAISACSGRRFLLGVNNGSIFLNELFGVYLCRIFCGNRCLLLSFCWNVLISTIREVTTVVGSTLGSDCPILEVDLFVRVDNAHSGLFNIFVLGFVWKGIVACGLPRLELERRLFGSLCLRLCGELTGALICRDVCFGVQGRFGFNGLRLLCCYNLGFLKKVVRILGSWWSGLHERVLWQLWLWDHSAALLNSRGRLRNRL